MLGDDVLAIARHRLAELRRAPIEGDTHHEKSEQSEKTPDTGAVPAPALLTDPLRAWRLRNAERQTEVDRQQGHDPGGFCAAHSRWLSYPEQKRGACSWCVPVQSEREPDYRAGHRHRSGERR